MGSNDFSMLTSIITLNENGNETNLLVLVQLYYETYFTQPFYSIKTENPLYGSIFWPFYNYQIIIND